MIMMDRRIVKSAAIKESRQLPRGSIGTITQLEYVQYVHYVHYVQL